MRYSAARRIRLVDVYVDHRCIATYPSGHALDADCIQEARRGLAAEGMVCPKILDAAAYRVRAGAAERPQLGEIQAAND